MANTVEIKVPVTRDDVPSFNHTKEEAVSFSQKLDKELDLFNTWFKSYSSSNLIGAERTIIRTYLAWKLIYEHAPEHPDP